jgi:UDP-N-acetyl-D-mannosaminuronic acid dehydrogenase
MSNQNFTRKVCIIGLGYIGLPTAALLANKGYDVLGVDINENVIKHINRGKVHIEETDLHILVSAAAKSGKLTAKSSPEEADVFIISVPTPFESDQNKRIIPDLSYVRAAVKSIAPFVKKGNLVILESTSPIGTTEDIVVKTLSQKTGLKLGKELFIAYSPERVLPGRILTELVMNDRVIGGIDESSAAEAKNFYSSFVEGNIYLTNARTAEFVKLVENAYRDVNIAFSNEISMIADQAGIDVWELIELANKHPRVNILKPGPGVGGHCIAVDPWFIISQFEDKAKLLKNAREVNDAKANFVLGKIVDLIKKKNLKSVACLGLAYKENIDDLRESPSLNIVKKLSSLKLAKIYACDPYVKEESVGGVKLYDLETAIAKSELIVLLVAHNEFIVLDVDKFKNKDVLDFKGMLVNSKK